MEKQTAQPPLGDSDEVFRDRIESTLENRDRLIADVLAKLEEAGYEADPFFDRLILDELLTNAILHGNDGEPSKQVEFRLFFKGELWGAEITDEGPGFDWRGRFGKVEQPADPFHPSGRGIALLRGLGAELHYSDGGRRVLVVRPPRLHTKRR